MELLMTIKEALTWLFICQPAETPTKSKRIARKIFSALVFIGLICGFSIHFAYICNIGLDNLEGSIFAFMGAIVFFCSAYIMAIVFVFRHQIAVIFEELSSIYETHKKTKAMKYLSHANNTTEWMCEFYRKYCVFLLVTLLVLTPISALICYMKKGHFDANHAFHISRVVVPWDQTTLFGYFVEQVITIYADGAVLVAFGVVSLLFVSICLHHRAFSEIFEHLIDEWNQRGGKKRNDEPCDERFLCDLMRFHTTKKQWFLDTVKFYSPIVLIQLINCMIMTSTAIFYLDLQFHHPNFEILPALCLLSLALGNLFIYCYFGKVATDSFDTMSDCVYSKVKWRKLSPKLRKYVILMLANMQRPLFYHGFQLAVVDLNTFIRLCRTVYTYYMMFKTITAQ